MKWRDIVIGSVATLVITIVSGIVIYYFTKEPPEVKDELLRYAIERTGSFQSEQHAVGLTTVRLANLGDLAAHNVRIAIAFPSELITDRRINLSSGELGELIVVEDSPARLTLKLPTLLPDEILAVSFLLSSSVPTGPEVSVKSDRSMAKEGSLLRPRTVPESEVQNWLPRLLPLLIGALIGIVGILLLRRTPRRSSLNNHAFVLLHQGVYEKAEELLQAALAKGEDGPHVFANYSLCLAKREDFESAQKYLAAAKFYAKSPHDRAVVLFNEALVALTKGDKSKAHSSLRSAIGLSKDIKSYCNYSKVFQELAAEDPMTQSILQNEGRVGT